MSVTSVYQASCQICDYIANSISTISHNLLQWSIDKFEIIGCAKAAHQLSQMGQHEAAKELILRVKELKKNAQ